MTDTKRYRVEGMTCGGCVNSVTNALTRALGDVDIDVQLDGGEVTIVGQHDEAQVREAIEDAGFDYAGVA